MADLLDGTGICTIAAGEVDIVVQEAEIDLTQYAVGAVRVSVATASIESIDVSQ